MKKRAQKFHTIDHQPLTTHHPQKRKYAGSIETLMKYKKIKLTPSGRASLSSSQRVKYNSKDQARKQTFRSKSKKIASSQ